MSAEFSAFSLSCEVLSVSSVAFYSKVPAEKKEGKLWLQTETLSAVSYNTTDC